jgi:hypothetical protein
MGGFKLMKEAKGRKSYDDEKVIVLLVAMALPLAS